MGLLLPAVSTLAWALPDAEVAATLSNPSCQEITMDLSWLCIPTFMVYQPLV